MLHSLSPSSSRLPTMITRALACVALAQAGLMLAAPAVAQPGQAITPADAAHNSLCSGCEHSVSAQPFMVPSFESPWLWCSAGPPANVRVPGPYRPPIEAAGIAACFDAANPPPPSIVAAFAELEANRQFASRYNQHSNHWSPNPNSPRTLTWSFIPDGTVIAGYPAIGDSSEGSVLFQVMDQAWGGNREGWIAAIQAGFDRWSELCGMRFVRLTYQGNPWDSGAPWFTNGNSNVGDIRVGMKHLDGPNGVLAYCFFPELGGDMVLDRQSPFVPYDLGPLVTRNIITHELGHGIGFNHVCPVTQSKLMEPYVSVNFDGPREDDLRAAIHWYGDKYEPNGTRQTATDLGVLADGALVSPSDVPAPPIPNGAITGISPGNDVDFYKIKRNGPPSLVSIIVTPVGSTYQSNPQDSGGNCPGGNNIDALRQADLDLEVQTASGTIMYSASNGAIGIDEHLYQYMIPGGGTVTYIRVGSEAVPTEAQLYKLTIQEHGQPYFAASDGSSSSQVNVTWFSFTGVQTYRVVRRASNESSQTVVGTTQNTSLQDTTAVPGVPYNYWVQAQFGNEWITCGGPDVGFRQSTIPQNNSCASATPLSAGTVNGTLIGSTNDGTASCGTSSQQEDVWYSYQNGPCSGTITVSGCAAATDLVLSLHSACGGSEIACNDNDAAVSCQGGPVGARVSAALLPYQSVRLRVSHTAASLPGNFALDVATPSNATPNGSPGTAIQFVSGDTLLGTTCQNGSPFGLACDPSSPRGEAWYWYINFNPQCSEQLQFTWTDPDTSVAVYTDSSTAPQACSNNGTLVSELRPGLGVYVRVSTPLTPFTIFTAVTLADADGDGICNELDQCPGGDDAVDCNQNGLPDCSEDLAHSRTVAQTFSGPNGASFFLGGWADIEAPGVVRMTYGELYDKPGTVGMVYFSPPNPWDAISSFRLSFDFQIGSGTGTTIADGIVIGVLAQTETTTWNQFPTFGEEIMDVPTLDALLINLQTWDPGTGPVNTVRIQRNASGGFPEGTPSFDLDNGQWHHAEISFEAAVLTIVLTPNGGAPETVFSQNIAPFFPSPYIFTFSGGRAGSPNFGAQRIDNVVITDLFNDDDCDGDGIPDGCDLYGCEYPVNDLCFNATTVGLGDSFFDLTNARGNAETSCSQTDTQDVWFKYTPPCDGLVRFETVDTSGFVPTLALFEECGGDELACTRNNAPSNEARLEYTVVAGQPVIIRVAGWLFNQGPGTLRLTSLADSDGDGVFDDCDVCPGGDDRIDSDLDGVPDACDQCAGFDDLVDSDGDGVPDGCDRCPGFDDSIDSNMNGVPDGCDTFCAGDTNGDSVINGADLSVLLAQFGQSVTPGSGADFNGDGTVNGADLSVLLSRFGQSC